MRERDADVRDTGTCGDERRATAQQHSWRVLPCRPLFRRSIRGPSSTDLYVLPGRDTRTQKLAHGFFGSEPRRVAEGGILVLVAVGDLGRGEHAFFQPRMPRECFTETRDLHQVQTDLRTLRRAHGYSTVTVLARLRGWSTFSPRSLAT